MDFINKTRAYYPLSVEWTPDNLWTYVQETRYFAPTLTFIILFVFTVAFQNGQRIPRLIRFLAGGTLVLGFSFSLATYTYYLMRYSWLEPATNMRQFYHLSQDLPTFLEQYEVPEVAEPVVFVSDNKDYTIDLLFAIEGAALLAGDSLMSHSPKSTGPVRLLIAVDQQKNDYLNQKLHEFSLRHGGRLVSVIEDVNKEIWEIKVDGKE